MFANFPDHQYELYLFLSAPTKAITKEGYFETDFLDLWKYQTKLRS